MISVSKLLWAARAFFYRLRFSSIGWMTYIGKPVSLVGTKGIALGKRVRIYPGVRMETHNKGRIVIGNNVSIGQNFHITATDEELIIGDNTTISGNVFITNIDHSYVEIDCHILNQPYIKRTTKIGENCFIGYGAAIQAGTILGKQCVVGTNAVVRGEFPDYSVIVGVPAKVVKRYNKITKEWERVT